MKTLVLLLLVAPVLLQVGQSLLRIVCCMIKNLGNWEEIGVQSHK